MRNVIVAGVGQESERIARCRAALSALHRAEHHIEPHCAVPFDLRVAVHGLGAVRLMEIDGSPQRARVDHGGEDEVLAIIVHTGQGTIRQGAREAALGPGVLCLLHGGEAFELSLAEGFRHHVVRVPRARMTECFPAWPVLVLCAIATNQGPAAMLTAHLQAMLEHFESLTPADLKGVSEALLCLLVSALSASLRSTSDGLSRIERYHLKRVKDFVRTQLGDPELSVRTIGEAMNLSPRYLHRLFANEPMRLMQWVVAERLEACHRELSAPGNSRQPVYLIAQNWGFHNQAHFSRIFRTRFGVSPTEVRDRQPLRAAQNLLSSAVGRDGDANIGALLRKTVLHPEC